MTDVGILTFLRNNNYGSTLQAYALQRTLREMGVDCEHVDYQPDPREKIFNLLRSGNSLRLILEGARKKSVTRDQQGDRDKREGIQAFYDRRMNLSPVCRNRNDLRQLNGRYTRFLCGSDQIWNPVWLNPAYFLDFVSPDKPKLAYAASLGVQELPSSAKARKIARLTESFSAISVREEEGARLFRQITGKTVPVMPDPVCLLTRENWLELAEHGKTDQPEESTPYILCYFLGTNPAYWEQVRQQAKQTGLSVLLIPVTSESYGTGLPLLEGLSPERFVRAVSRASVLYTDSFHGLVFGTIMGIQVRLFQRESGDDPERKTSRTDHFLRLMEKQTPDDLRRQGCAWLKQALLSSD